MFYVALLGKESCRILVIHISWGKSTNHSFLLLMRTHLVSTDKNKKDSRIQLFQSNINYAQTQIHACLWVKFMWSLQIFFVKCFENNICSPSMMFLKIISAAWEVFCGVSLRSILNPADSSKHWLSAHSLNILHLGDHFVFPKAWLILWKRIITWRSYPPQTHNAKNLKKQGFCDFDWGGGGDESCS